MLGIRNCLREACDLSGDGSRIRSDLRHQDHRTQPVFQPVKLAGQCLLQRINFCTERSGILIGIDPFNLGFQCTQLHSSRKLRFDLTKRLLNRKDSSFQSVFRIQPVGKFLLLVKKHLAKHRARDRQSHQHKSDEKRQEPRPLSP